MLETEFLKLKYHANVESSSDATDVEEFFNNNFKKIDANAKKNYEDLDNIKKGELNILKGVETVAGLTNTGKWSDGTWRSASGGNATRTRINIVDSPNRCNKRLENN